MSNRYTINKIDEFLEIFDWQEMQTVFVTESAVAASTALTLLRTKGKLSKQIVEVK